jgi:hypothetical protein
MRVTMFVLAASAQLFPWFALGWNPASSQQINLRTWGCISDGWASISASLHIAGKWPLVLFCLAFANVRFRCASPVFTTVLDFLSCLYRTSITWGLGTANLGVGGNLLVLFCTHSNFLRSVYLFASRLRLRTLAKLKSCWMVFMPCLLMSLIHNALVM